MVKKLLQFRAQKHYFLFSFWSLDIFRVGISILLECAVLLQIKVLKVAIILLTQNTDNLPCNIIFFIVLKNSKIQARF